MLAFSGKKYFECPDCDRIFERKGELTVHRRTHIGEKPYQCTECSKSFPRKTALTIHMRTHTGEKPYQCPKCGKAFSQSSSMKTHLKMHIRDEKYKCPECQKSYKNEEALANHIKHHGLADILLSNSRCAKVGVTNLDLPHKPLLSRGSESVPYVHCAEVANQSSNTNSPANVIDCSPEKVKQEPVDDINPESGDPLNVETRESWIEPLVKIENQDENCIYIKEERT